MTSEVKETGENPAPLIEAITDEEKKLLEDYVKDLQERLTEKQVLRDLNNRRHENEGASKKREANVKKNAAFVKKLKTVTESQHGTLLAEASVLDLTRYLAEIVQALTHDCKLKINDVPFVVKLCCQFHQTYDEFSSMLADAWQRNCLVPSNKTTPNEPPTTVTIANVNKLKVDIRLLGELVAVGVWPSDREGFTLLAGQLRAMTASPDATILSPVIITFLKYCGPEYSRLYPRRMKTAAKKMSVSFPEFKVVPDQFLDGCQRLLKEYLNIVVRKFTSDQKEFRQLENQCLRALQQRGELPIDERTRWESGKLDLDRLKNTVTTLADLVDEDMPVLDDLPDQDDASGGSDLTAQQQKLLERQQLLAAAAAISEGSAPEPADLFADENELSFYRKLPELQQATVAAKDDDDDEPEGDVEIAIDSEDYVPESADKKADKKEPPEDKKKDKEKEKEKEDTTTPTATATAGEDPRTIRRKKLQSLLESLPNCANRELMDKMAQELVTNGFTGRGTSLRLARTLLAAPRTRYYVLPFYARLIASLRPVMPDLSDKVCNALSKEFGFHIHKKDQVKVEAKLKTVRFIGELVKFGLFGRPDVLRFLSTLVRDFHHHSIEMAAALLESCGRQLCRWPDSQLKMRVIVDAIARKRVSQVLDPRHQLLLDNALVCVQKQDESSGAGGATRDLGDPLHLYIIHQLTRELNRSTASAVMRRLRMLDWDDEALYDWLPNVILSVVGTKLPYSRLPLLASLIAALDDYGYSVIGIRIVDTLLEHIRLSLEVSNQSFLQVRLAEARLLGEAYNYRLCDSPVILRTLYLLITFGAHLPDVDPPENLFRIRMASNILDTCGPYFDRGAHKRKLDTFLLYFQLYYWQKRADAYWANNGLVFPLDAAHQFADTMGLLRPDTKPFTSLAQVEKAVFDKEQEMAKLVPKLGEQSAGRDSVVEESDDGDDDDDDDEHEGDDEKDDEQIGDEDDVVDDDDEDGEDEEEGGEEEDEPESGTGATQEMEEEKAKPSLGPREIHCPEDDEFMAELDMALASAQSIASGPANTLPSALSDLPSNALRTAKAKAVQQVQQFRPTMEVESSSESDHTPDVVPFVLLARKGNKPQLAPLAVPRKSALASGYLKHLEAEDAEKAQLKKMILSHQYRQEREEMDTTAERLPSSRQAKDSAQAQQQPYQPPRGYQQGWSGRGGRL